MQHLAVLVKPKCKRESEVAKTAATNNFDGAFRSDSEDVTEGIIAKTLPSKFFLRHLVQKVTTSFYSSHPWWAHWSIIGVAA